MRSERPQPGIPSPKCYYGVFPRPRALGGIFRIEASRIRPKNNGTHHLFLTFAFVKR